NLEAAVQQVVDATLIRGTVTEDMSVPFPPASQIARWSSSGHRIVTRPTTCAFTALLGTIINSSPVDLAEVVVAYDLGGQASSAEDNANELAGHIVYYSLTGLPNSWLPATDLSGGSLGPKQATLSLGLWPVGTHLYILWVDDNAVGTQTAGDGIYTIDNFQVLTPDGSPPKFLSATADPYNPNV